MSRDHGPARCSTPAGLGAASGRAPARFSALLLALACLAGCGAEEAIPAAASSGADGERLTVRVLLRDGVFRAPGAECSGTASMADLHATAPFRLLDDEDRLLAEGELPAGRAVSAVEAELDAALDEDTAPRRPTFCEVTVTVTAPSSPSYRLAVADREPLPLTAAEDDQWVTALP
ncbi:MULTISPECIES: hypothetical protein [Actinoalloteichus]|uniref:Uncharacterized protein n=1 Tax=Actinoalloteichus fjordicus TaxID=1612552 RepID=A0AAC9LE04_9PSEU|nr:MULTISPECIES: hypothetical protein [Actinoalloteichus]APU14549.1 hypothetical protein UA74_12445 [Actinoalloteichus fjordicus]APU20517.1 hypothetical protein UA75_12525 [Actinoalloteichus sp. GBA129-24]